MQREDVSNNVEYDGVSDGGIGREFTPCGTNWALELIINAGTNVTPLMTRARE